MPQQKLPKPDARDRQTLRSKQSDDFEVLCAASEAAFQCDGWMVDQRIILGGLS